ncbi:MAG: glycoside hydrolase family 5 protein [Candidatus Hermodarchaeota archaeon]
MKGAYLFFASVICMFLISNTYLIPQAIVGAQSNATASTTSILSQGTIDYSLNLTPEPTPTPTFSALHVDGNKLKDANGNVVVLRGVDDSITTWWDSGVGYDTEQFAYMRDWGCNAVRITISDWDIGYTPGNLGVYENAAFWTRLDNLVNGAISNGIYPIICGWATMGPSPDGIYSGVVSDFIPKYHTWTDFLNVYSLLAQRYAGKNVIYELWNEPLYCPLDTYKTYMEAAVDAIRTYDANAIVIVEAVSTGGWETWNLQFVKTHHINRPNIVYCVHQYGSYDGVFKDSSPSGILNSLGSNGAYTCYADWVLANGYPVIITEFGISGVGTTPVSSQHVTWLNNFMSTVDDAGYCGYTAWRWATPDLVGVDALLADWYGNPTTFGQVIRDYYVIH